MLLLELDFPKKLELDFPFALLEKFSLTQRTSQQIKWPGREKQLSFNLACHILIIQIIVGLHFTFIYFIICSLTSISHLLPSWNPRQCTCCSQRSPIQTLTRHSLTLLQQGGGFMVLQAGHWGHLLQSCIVAGMEEFVWEPRLSVDL